MAYKKYSFVTVFLLVFSAFPIVFSSGSFWRIN